MPTERLSMRKIQEVLRLHAAGHSQQDISRSYGIGRSTVGEYLQRAGEAGLSWPLSDDLDTAALERRLFPPAALAVAVRGLPDWATMHRELRRPGVTLWLLWEGNTRPSIHRATSTPGFASSIGPRRRAPTW